MVIPNVWCVPRAAYVRQSTYPGTHARLDFVRAMSREISQYPEPEEFRPERFLQTDGEAGKLDIPLPSSYVFGFGRRYALRVPFLLAQWNTEHVDAFRVCPGQAFADATLWLAIVRILAVFDIRKPLGPNGEERTPPAAFFSGFTRWVRPDYCGVRRILNNGTASRCHSNVVLCRVPRGSLGWLFRRSTF